MRAAGTGTGGLPGGVQPDQHGPDAPRPLHGRRQARLPHRQDHPAAAGQRALAGHGGLRQTVSHTAGLSRVSA